jgi:hypothetical protein
MAAQLKKHIDVPSFGESSDLDTRQSMFDDWLPKAHSKQAIQALSIGQFVHA